MCYYSYLKSGHFEQGESFIDFLWSLLPQAKAFAQKFYHADGICLPAVMTIDGQPLGGWAMYAYSPTNQLWLCQLFERHYRFSGDREFLENKAYFYLSESAKFILSVLIEKDGKYKLPASSSPEIHDNSPRAWLTPNSNYDLALMRYLFESLSYMSDLLENGEGEKWRECLSKLPGLAANEGVLMLSPDECLTESHRHLAHLMAIHPLRLLQWQRQEDRPLIEKSIANLEYLGTGKWTGYTFAWMAEIYAIAKNGEGAAYQLKLFWENFCLPNGFHCNGDYKGRGLSTYHYRPFTLEGNMCAADALQEMLLYSEDSVVECFPAIPDDWRSRTVSFQGLRAERGLSVSATLHQGQITKLCLDNKYAGQYILRGIPESLIGNHCKYTRCGDDFAVYLEDNTEYVFNLSQYKE